ncbi:MAG TPA: amidohydrolase family protein [Vicinamibacterales bacterium]
MDRRHGYRAARLFTGDQVMAPGTVVLNGPVIEWVGGGVPPMPVRLEDLGDATLLPGLIDAHSHVSIDPAAGDQIGQLRRSADARLASARLRLPIDLASGVTTMRVMGEEDGVDLQIAQEIASGALAGPDLICAGVQIAREGHHGHALTGVSGEAGITLLARGNVSRGARALKIFATGGISSSGTADAAPFTAAEIACAAAVAREHGVPLAAHAHGGAGLRHAIEGGVDTIEHAAALDDASLDRILARGLMVVGTFSILYHPDGIARGDAANPEIVTKLRAARETMERSWRAIVASGARIAVGTDSMHGRLAFDIARLVDFGATPQTALTAATIGGAEACGLTDRGRLAPGLRADVVAVHGDPFTDISCLVEPRLVIANGHVR